MLTSQDIEKLTNYLVEVLKSIFATKEDFKELKDDFSKFQRTVDNIAKEKLTREQESAVLAYRMKNAEDWIDKAAPKVELEFRH